MAKVGKFCLAKRVKVEWLFHHILCFRICRKIMGIGNGEPVK